MISSFNPGDSLQSHNGYKFSTKDQDNDIWGKNCAEVYKGGWWFSNCMNSDLNGPYHKSAVQSWGTVNWTKFGNNNVSLKRARMMIRPKV